MYYEYKDNKHKQNAHTWQKHGIAGKKDSPFILNILTTLGPIQGTFVFLSA
jgi:hypothetical protein